MKIFHESLYLKLLTASMKASSIPGARLRDEETFSLQVIQVQSKQKSIQFELSIDQTIWKKMNPFGKCLIRELFTV